MARGEALSICCPLDLGWEKDPRRPLRLLSWEEGRAPRRRGSSCFPAMDGPLGSAEASREMKEGPARRGAACNSSPAGTACPET